MQRIPFLQLKFLISANEAIHLPRYKGSMLRGGFGNAFKKAVCAIKGEKCEDCLLRTKCVYVYNFESPLVEEKAVAKSDKTPHPFVLEPPLDDSRFIEQGEEMGFSLILLGRAVEHLPYYIYAFDRLGSIGIGKGRGKFRLECIEHNGSVIYSSENIKLQSVKPLDLLEYAENKANMDSSSIKTKSSLTINFLTPTRIVYKGHLTIDIEFHIIIQSLLRRLNEISLYHCEGKELDIDYQGLIKRAEAIVTEKSNLRWYDWERYSARQKTRMKLGGFVGEITFKGDGIEEFLPFLFAGEVIHIGKGTSFGLGRYQIL